MYKIYLIQNQSEMFHYYYADARNMLCQYGFDVKLYTSENIFLLKNDINKNDVDCIIFGSNALNDNIIVKEVFSEEFKIEFKIYLENEKSCIILSQNKLAHNNKKFTFLPDTFEDVFAQPRINEKSVEGNLYIPDHFKKNVYFLFPNIIDENCINDSCINSDRIKGLYWNYLNLSQNEWDGIIFDNSKEKNRVLIAKSKKYNVLISSIILDWQYHDKLLHNIIINLIAKYNYLGILTCGEIDSTGFKYFIESLKVQKYFFKVYDLKKNTEELKINLNNRIHNTYIIAPNIELANISPNLKDEINNIVYNKDIRLIDLKNNDDINNFVVYGSDITLKQHLVDLEFYVQEQLEKGYVENSFWKTIETLQTLMKLKKYLVCDYNYKNLKKVFTLLDKHDVDGSYDETFGATVALLWIRSTYLGQKNNETCKTLKWIEKNINKKNFYEYIFAKSIILSTIKSSREEYDDLSILISKELTEDVLYNSSENNILNYLQVAVTVKNYTIIEIIIDVLDKLDKDGIWLDISTTSSMVSVLIDVLIDLDHSNVEFTGRRKLEQLIFKAIKKLKIYITESLTKNRNSKINIFDCSLVLKSIEACLKFESLINFPVNELLNVIEIAINKTNFTSVNQDSTVLLEQLRVDKNNLEKKQKEQSQIIKRLSKHRRLFKTTIFVTLLMMYISITHCYYLIKNDLFADFFEISVIKAWGLHITLISFFITIGTFLNGFINNAKKGK